MKLRTVFFICVAFFNWASSWGQTYNAGNVSNKINVGNVFIKTANAPEQILQLANEGDGVVVTLDHAGVVKEVRTETAFPSAKSDGKTADVKTTTRIEEVTQPAAESDFEVVNGTLVKYVGEGGDVVIPATLDIHTIGYQAFQHCNTITALEIPSSVKIIDKAAFNGCANLTYVKLPTGIQSISDMAFLYCHSLKEIDIPPSVKAIGYWGFFNNTLLRDAIVRWKTADSIPKVNAFQSSATLHVPVGMITSYKSLTGWEKFGNYLDESAENKTLELNHPWGWALRAGETLQLTATIDGKPAQGVTWTSDDPSIATVSATGLVRMIKTNGNTYVRASTANGLKDNCQILDLSGWPRTIWFIKGPPASYSIIGDFSIIPY